MSKTTTRLLAFLVSAVFLFLFLSSVLLGLWAAISFVAWQTIPLPTLQVFRALSLISVFVAACFAASDEVMT